MLQSSLFPITLALSLTFAFSPATAARDEVNPQAGFPNAQNPPHLYLFNSATAARAETTKTQPAASKKRLVAGEQQWFVVAGSFPMRNRRAAENRLRLVQQWYSDAYIVATDDYPGFRPGLWAVVIGPYSTQNEADTMLYSLKKNMIPDAYIKNAAGLIR